MWRITSVAAPTLFFWTKEKPDSLVDWTTISNGLQFIDYGGRETCIYGPWTAQSIPIEECPDYVRKVSG